MATKPAYTPEWASAGTNNTEPSLAQKQSGWTVGQDGVSDYDNWFKENVYRWCEYINDGVLEGPITVDGDLTVDGDAHVTGDMTIDGQLVHGDWLITGKFRFSDAMITVAGTPGVNAGVVTGVAHYHIDWGVDGDAYIEIPYAFNAQEKVKSIVLHYADNANANTAVDVYFGLPNGQLQLQTSTGGAIASGVSDVTVTLDTPANPFYGLWVRITTTSGGTGPKLMSWRVTCGA